MQYQSLLNSIKRNVLASVYLICGEEDYLQELMLKALKEALINSDFGSFNLDELDGEKVSPGQIVQSAVGLPVFAEKRLVIVYNPPFLKSRKKDSEKDSENDSEKNSKKEESLLEERAILEYLADPLTSTCLVFWVKGPVDKRKKTVKAIAKTGVVLEVNAYKGVELNDWLINETRMLGKTLETKALEYIVLHSNNSLRHLKSELEKMALYSGNEKVITLTIAEKLLIKTSEASIFVLVDNIGLKNAETALIELRSLLGNGEAPVKVLFMIARQFRLILLAKELAKRGLTEKQITSELSLHPFVTGKILRQAGKFSFEELETCMQQVLEGDIAIKTGAPGGITLEGLILNLAGSTQTAVL